ncbi:MULTISPECIES: transglycosylase SLT domain-containing protein [unclassified Thermosipho (in: thermotogales)]|uniref:transglycosylase SLT domain-containing protein n=1 Tax=unclassified Thermosipho (in: thermotogales) TaxID=2676525 RepID=UPI000984EBFC|nr:MULTISPECIES: transglycosylase SLT domain-containing protein [unclassified Thermosipho (in: thermotogales)]MBT1247530.1 lytic transglycosylase [Thermosipho sp. 1244]OOC46226.1 lytic transglycosylase [Thermosipho sp. 1223]
MKKWIFVFVFLILFSIVYALPGEWFRNFVKEYRRAYGLPTDDELLTKIEDAILDASKETGLDPLLITSVIIVESEFRNVIGLYGELGMMQIKPETADFVANYYNLKKPKEGWTRILWDFKLNIKIGSYYLKYLYDKFGNIQEAVKHYNGGIYKEQYAERILEKYQQMLKVASVYENNS